MHHLDNLLREAKLMTAELDRRRGQLPREGGSGCGRIETWEKSPGGDGRES